MCCGCGVVCWSSRRRVSLSSRRDHRRILPSLYEVSWREGWVRKDPARPTARSTDRLPYRPPLRARVALVARSAKSTRGVLRPCETTKTALPGSRAPARARHALCMSSGRRRRGCARPPCSDLRSNGSQFVSIHGRRIDDNHRDMTRRVRAPGWRSQAPTIRGRCAYDGFECRKRRSGVLWGCRVLTRTLGGTLAKGHFHLIGGQSGLVNYRRRVVSTGSDECEVSETICRS